METSQSYLKKMMEQLGENWKEILDSFFKEDDEQIDDDMENCILSFLDACKEEIIADKPASLQKVEKMIDNDLLYKNIQVYLDKMLQPFYVSAPLRTHAVKDEAAAIRNIEAIFQNAILRFYPNISKQYAKYGFENQDAFINFLNVFDSMCAFTISKSFCREAIEDFIYAQTRLPKKMCKKVAELIDANFLSLQMNYIIERISKRDSE